MKNYIRALVLGLAAWAAATPAAAVPVWWSGNGHWYEVVYMPYASWSDARANATSNTALGLQWDLATISSQAEQDFVAALLGPPPPPDTVFEYWIGGFQPPGSAEPGGGWSWISGEPFVYTSWGTGEPNNVPPGENHLALDNRYQWGWNDNDPFLFPYVTGFVEEAVSEPGTLLLIGSGAVGLARFRRRRRIDS